MKYLPQILVKLKAFKELNSTWLQKYTPSYMYYHDDFDEIIFIPVLCGLKEENSDGVKSHYAKQDVVKQSKWKWCPLYIPSPSPK